MNQFSIAVTGDIGEDVYTRYIPSYINEGADDFYPETAFDQCAPSGAGLHVVALKALLRARGISVLNWTPRAPTLARTLHFLREYPEKEGSPIRISRAVPIKGFKPDVPGVLKLPKPRANAHVLVIHDATEIWRTSEDARQFLLSFLSRVRDGDTYGTPSVLVILQNRIPELRLDKSGKVTINELESPIWTELLSESNAKHVAIICSVESLRHAGAAISRRLSWERIVQDTLADVRLFQPLQALSRSQHLFIRVGYVGFIHIQNGSESQLSTSPGQLIFAPSARNAIFTDEAQDGRIRGQDSLVAACLLRSMSTCRDRKSSWEREEIAAALKCGLTASMYLYDRGFACPSSLRPDDDFLERYFRPEPKGGASGDHVARIVSTHYDELIGHLPIPRDRMFGIAKLPPLPSSNSKTKPWDILRSQVRSLGISRINLGIAICKFGHRRVLNLPLDKVSLKGGIWENKLKQDLIDILSQPECILSVNETSDDEPLDANVRVAAPHPTDYEPPRPHPESLYIPLFEVGHIVAIERAEIESFRSIQNLMQQYVASPSQGKSPTSGRPISIAVFGPPGSGKSFAIKQIAESIDDGISGDFKHLHVIECNVSQFRSVEDLGHVITRIASVNNRGKIPLVFFDEFDCALGNEALGWLKYFLAPMQDGTFYGSSQTISFGRAIFVFAGGIYQTLAAFDPFTEEVRGPSSENVESQLKRQMTFRDRKGPDFVSRLRGHINILSLNPDQTAPKDEYGNPQKPVLRRALILRSQILHVHLFDRRDRCEVAKVDKDVLYAFLTVERYRHGARSMEAILQMCTPIDGVIEKASLPSPAQLNMHVDPEDFMTRVLRGRFRRFLTKKDHPVGRGEAGRADGRAKGGVESDTRSEERVEETARVVGVAKALPVPPPVTKRRQTPRKAKKPKN